MVSSSASIKPKVVKQCLFNVLSIIIFPFTAIFGQWYDALNVLIVASWV